MSDAAPVARLVPGNDCPADAVDVTEQPVARCNGLCFRASDVGVEVPGDPVAYPNLLCPEHWGEVQPNG